MAEQQSTRRIVRLTLSVIILTVALIFGYPASLKSVQTPSHHVVRRQQPIVDFGPTNISSLSSRSIAVPFGHDNYHLNASLSSIPRLLRKRDPELFDYYVCKGGELWQRAQDAFDGQVPPGRVFTETDATRTGGWVTVDDSIDMTERWRRPFTDRLGGVPPKADVRKITKSQIVGFINDFGQQYSTQGFYSMNFIPSKNAIMALNVFSPKRELRGRADPVPEDQIPQYLPRLNRLSDMMWTVWASIQPEESRGGLRYIMHDDVTNDDTAEIMEDSLMKAGDSLRLPWPGKTYRMDTDEGKALLGTPNGLATAWLMIDRAAILGRRDPTITIWDCDIAFCMLWDMVPV
ncbi:MAG: hypothetical protein Q9222_006067 [Ikaeria aurantiellina]